MLSQTATNTPYLFHRGDGEQAALSDRVGQIHYPAGLGILLGSMVGEFRQGLARPKTNATSDTGPLPDDLPPLTSQRFQIGKTAGIDETLVNAVHLKRRGKSGDGLHHSVGDIGIEPIITRKDCNTARVKEIPATEIRLPHRNTQQLGLGITGNDTAIVVGQHHHRLAAQIRAIDLLTRGKKRIGINQGEHGWPCLGAICG